MDRKKGDLDPAVLKGDTWHHLQWTQRSPQTESLGRPAQASEDELAKNKSLSSKQLLISPAGENLW